MRWRVYLLVSWVLVILISIPIVSGDVVTTANPVWIVANGRDSSNLTINVTDIFGNPIPGANIAFSVNDTTLGFVYPETGITGLNGLTSTVFRSKTKSGTAKINVSVNGTVQGSGLIFIDHDTPYSFRFLSFPDNATVGSIQNVTVGMQDIHGNFIDNRNQTEYIEFSIITLGDASRFWNTSSGNFSSLVNVLPNNKDGLTTINISLATEPGDTLIRLKPQGNLSEKTITITRLANGIPYSMAIKRDPSVPYVPADNKSIFTFTFILYDQYGNGLNNKEIELNSSTGDWGPLLVTTIEGRAAVNYGPYPLPPFSADISAYAVENRSVNRTLTVEFYDPAPRELLLTVSPITMPSADVPNSSYAIVTASVVDLYGKPVSGQDVTFSLGAARYPDGPYTINASPYLENPYLQTFTATTDAEGFTYVKFYPGAFTRDINDSLYADMATGEVDIQATWGGKTRIVTPVWKNYPYLSVYTFVDDPVVQVNDTVNVSLLVRGDGFALLPKPIDLILTTNRGSSMLGDMYWQEDPDVWADKMVYLHSNAQFLLSYLNPDPNQTYHDRAGVVSFGVEGLVEYPDSIPGDDNKKTDDSGYILSHYQNTSAYGDYATVDHILDENIPAVNQSVKTITPYGDKKNQNHVPMRYGIYKSIDELLGYGNSTYRRGSIKAIVLLSDSDWNDYGDPLAGWDGSSVATSLGYYEEEKDPTKFPESGRSQWTAFHKFGNQTDVGKDDPRQNLAYYAAENNIIVFPIAYFKKGTSIPAALDDRFQEFADETGGVYYKADSGEALQQIFEDIGRRLRQEAGVNTTATLNFSEVMLNNITVPGNQAFDYVFWDGVSTRLRKWNASTVMYDNTTNQSADWEDDQKLNFNLGTMFLGDVWQGNFTLRAKQAGTVQFFGNGSTITFNEGESITLPELFQYSQPIRFGDVPTENLAITYFNVSDSFNAAFDVTYTGEKPVHVKLYYQKIGDIGTGWKQYATLNYQCTDHTCGSIHGERSINKWDLGTGLFMFKIEAWASDTPMDTAQDGPKEIKRKFFIWLQ